MIGLWLQLTVPHSNGRHAEGLVAVEPMSGSTDCFNNGDGLVVLQAGEEWGGSFGVRLEA